MSKITIILLMFACTACSSQSVVETTFASQNAIVYTPPGYTPTKKYKTIVFFPGLGEAGTNILSLYTNGPAKFLRDGSLKPSSIVVCVQPIYGWVPAITYEATLQAIYAKYPVDSFALTGLSAGAFAIFNYLVARTTNLPISAIVPMSFDVDDPSNNDLTKYKGIRSWGLAGVDDSRYPRLKFLMERLAANGYSAKFTGYPGGHCCWNTYYAPTFRENSLSVYDFMTGIFIDSAVSSDPIVVAKCYTGKATRYTLPYTPAGGIYKAESYFRNLSFLKPGDTLDIPGIDYSIIAIGKIKGDSCRPIYIRNVGLVTSQGFRLDDDCQYIKLLGDGDSRYRYGFKLGGQGGSAMAIGLAQNIEAGFIEITNTDVGLFVKKQPDTTDKRTIFPNYVIHHIRLHDFYVHKVNGEAGYIGHTYPEKDPYSNNLTPIRLDNIEVWRWIVEDCGWDGIQVATAQNVWIHDNTIHNYGMANIGGQRAGIILGGVTTGRMSYNTIIKGNGNAIQTFGYGPIEIDHNYVDSAGEQSIYTSDYKDNITPRAKQKLNIHDNTIKHGNTYAIIALNYRNAQSDTSRFINNIIYLSDSLNWRSRLYSDIPNIQTNNSLMYTGIPAPVPIPIRIPIAKYLITIYSDGTSEIIKQ